MIFKYVPKDLYHNHLHDRDPRHRNSHRNSHSSSNSSQSIVRRTASQSAPTDRGPCSRSEEDRRSDQIRSSQIAPDRTTPHETRPDQTKERVYRTRSPDLSQNASAARSVAQIVYIRQTSSAVQYISFHRSELDRAFRRIHFARFSLHSGRVL